MVCLTALFLEGCLALRAGKLERGFSVHSALVLHKPCLASANFVATGPPATEAVLHYSGLASRALCVASGVVAHVCLPPCQISFPVVYECLPRFPVFCQVFDVGPVLSCFSNQPFPVCE